MSHKTDFPKNIHTIPVVVVDEDKSIKSFGVEEPEKIDALLNGQTIPFKTLSQDKKTILIAAMMANEEAMADVRNMGFDKVLDRLVICVCDLTTCKRDCRESIKMLKNTVCLDRCKY